MAKKKKTVRNNDDGTVTVSYGITPSSDYCSVRMDVSRTIPLGEQGTDEALEDALDTCKEFLDQAEKELYQRLDRTIKKARG